MAFVHGKSIFVLLNGFNITGYLNKIDAPFTADTAETSTFGQDTKTYIAGMKDATLSAEGLFDGAVDSVDQQLNTVLAGSNTVNNMIWFPGGNVLGGVGYGLSMIQTAYSVMGTKDDAVKISMAGHSNVGRERLKLIKILEAKTIDGSGTVNDNGASSANGGAAYLQVTTSSQDVDITVEHSSDNFAADTTLLATFSNLASVVATCVVKAASAITDILTVTSTLALGSTANQLNILLTTAGNDTLAVTKTDGTYTINIALAKTTAAKNAAANIQTAIQALGTVGGIDVSAFTCAAGGNWDTAAIATGEAGAVMFSGGVSVVNRHERIAITGTIKRYVRTTYAFNGGAGATFAVALCRK